MLEWRGVAWGGVGWRRVAQRGSSALQGTCIALRTVTLTRDPPRGPVSGQPCQLSCIVYGVATRLLTERQLNSCEASWVREARVGS